MLPVADEQLACPNRNKNFCLIIVAVLHDGGAFAGLAATTTGIGEFSPQSGKSLLAVEIVTLVGWRVNGGVGPSSQFGVVRLQEDIDHVQLVPFGFTGTEFVADEINQQREEDDITR